MNCVWMFMSFSFGNYSRFFTSSWLFFNNEENYDLQVRFPLFSVLVGCPLPSPHPVKTDSNFFNNTKKDTKIHFMYFFRILSPFRTFRSFVGIQTRKIISFSVLRKSKTGFTRTKLSGANSVRGQIYGLYARWCPKPYRKRIYSSEDVILMSCAKLLPWNLKWWRQQHENGQLWFSFLLFCFVFFMCAMRWGKIWFRMYIKDPPTIPHTPSRNQKGKGRSQESFRQQKSSLKTGPRECPLCGWEILLCTCVYVCRILNTHK